MQFTELMASADFAKDCLSVAIPPSWMQGRTIYGGLSAALCLEAAGRAFPDMPPLRSTTVSFIGPAGGAVAARARMLRQGKSVTFVEVDLHGEQGMATRCVFAFGAARPSEFDQSFTVAPALPGPDDCEAFIQEDRAPSFADNFEMRLARGARPFIGAGGHDHFIWVRYKDQRASDNVALLALADMPPPAVTSMFETFAPISSMTWMLNMAGANPKTRDGWWLLQTRAECVGEGYTSQNMIVWSRDGVLAVAGRQSVAIFA